MTTHLRARALQAGALLVLLGGMLAVASAPAQAVGEPTVKITSLSATDVPSGGSIKLSYRVSNPIGALQTSATITVSGMSCAGEGCTPVKDIPAGQSQDFDATLTAPKADPGQTKKVTIQVNATIGGRSGSARQDVTVRGADKPQTVRQVSGRVKDQGGQPIAAANVGMQDSAGHQYDTVTNDEGRYSFNSSDDKPIVVGTISVAALKNGYKVANERVNGAAGKTINVSLILASATASPSVSPSASVTPSPTPTEDATDGALADDPTDDATDAPNLNNAASKDDGNGSLLFIILGGLLVAAGVGAIVLVIMRRRSAGDDPDAPDGGAGPNGVVPPSGGRYQGIPDATRVAAPMGTRLDDATMITHLPGPASLADQPTLLQQAVPADEFPDPYGAPSAQPHGGYTSATGYGAPAAAPPASQYGAAPQYGATPAPPPAYGGNDGYGAAQPDPYARPVAQPDDPYAAYGAPTNGYDQPQRFDEPTGMYRPQDNIGEYGQEPSYDQPGYRPEPEYPSAPAGGGRARPDSTATYQAGGYQPAADYGQQPDQGGHGGWDAPAGGVDDAYGPPATGGYAAGGTAYGAPAGGAAYGAPADNGAGYVDQGGYDPRPAYGSSRQPSGGYGAAQPPAGPPTGYVAGPQPAGGYGGQPQGGYGQPDEYATPDEYADQAGYGDPGGYGGAPGQGDNGQPAQDGYHGAEQGGGRHGGRSRPPESTHPGQRRPLDWLDD